MRLPSIDAAIAELDCAVPWLRGHVAHHRLLPASFRLSGGEERERIRDENPDLEALIAEHHRYVPTKLLAWTRSLRVALFCALIREHDQPAVFVMAPAALNALSDISGIVSVSAFRRLHGTPQEHPIAVEVEYAASAEKEELFTLHGRNPLALEDQCPSCVRRVILTASEAALATDYVLSATDLRHYPELER